MKPSAKAEAGCHMGEQQAASLYGQRGTARHGTRSAGRRKKSSGAAGCCVCAPRPDTAYAGAKGERTKPPDAGRRRSGALSSAPSAAPSCAQTHTYSSCGRPACSALHVAAVARALGDAGEKPAKGLDAGPAVHSRSRASPCAQHTDSMACVRGMPRVPPLRRSAPPAAAPPRPPWPCGARGGAAWRSAHRRGLTGERRWALGTITSPRAHNN